MTRRLSIGVLHTRPRYILVEASIKIRIVGNQNNILTLNSSQIDSAYSSSIAASLPSANSFES